MSFALAAAGDIIMSGALTTRSQPILDRLRDADLATSNLEFVVTGSRAAADKFICLGMSPKHFADFTSLGFRVVSVANNHALDFGVDGLRDTLAQVRAAGMLPVGGGETLAESLAPSVQVAAGMRVAVLAASATLPNSSAAGPHSPGIAPLRIINRYRMDGVTVDESPGMSPFVETEVVAGDLEALKSAVRSARAEADIVVLHLHWGIPLGWVAAVQDEIAGYQRPVAHALIDAGASLIVGHHPHVVQGVEFYRGVPILYSLGNFIKHKIAATGGRDGIHPAYRIASLRTEWNRIGALAQAGLGRTRRPPVLPLRHSATRRPRRAIAGRPCDCTEGCRPDSGSLCGMGHDGGRRC
ncbi:hypothetical protein FALB51S_02545 [Frigidibacter albus]